MAFGIIIQIVYASSIVPHFITHLLRTITVFTVSIYNVKKFHWFSPIHTMYM